MISTKTLVLVASTIAILGGCKAAARDSKMYADDTGKALAAKNNDIQACYDGVLKATPGVGGTVTVHFDMPAKGDDGAGKVTNVTVDKAATTAPDAVSDCVKNSITNAGPLDPPDERKGQGTW